MMCFEWPPKSINFNTRNLPQAHHVIEYAGETQERTVRICRCWQSRKFPYCDDSHKLLMESGDSVGPLIVKIEPHFPQDAKNLAEIGNKNSSSSGIKTSDSLKRVKKAAPQFFFAFAGMALIGIAARHALDKIPTLLKTDARKISEEVREA